MFHVVPSALTTLGIVVTCAGVALVVWRHPAPPVPNEQRVATGQH
jgi:hypothetical protein